MLETSLEGFSLCWRLLRRDFHCAGDFLERIFMVLETSSGDFHGAGDFFWRFSRCWRLLWKDFHGAGDFSGDFQHVGDFF